MDEGKGKRGNSLASVITVSKWINKMVKAAMLRGVKKERIQSGAE